MAVTTDTSAGAAIRPFHLGIPEAEVQDLRARVAATRLPEKETGRAPLGHAGPRPLLGDRV
jgi:hypothetical protein